MGWENTNKISRKCWPPAHWGVSTFTVAWLTGAGSPPLPSFTREHRTHITSLGKDQNSKSEVQFLLIVYHVHTHKKLKNHKPHPPKLGTWLYLSGNKDLILCGEVSAGDERLGVIQTERVLGVSWGSGLLREHLGLKEVGGPGGCGHPRHRTHRFCERKQSRGVPLVSTQGRGRFHVREQCRRPMLQATERGVS